MTEPKTKPKTSRVSITVSKSIISSLERMAEEVCLSRAELIRRILKKEILMEEMELEQTALKEGAGNVIPFPACGSSPW